MGQFTGCGVCAGKIDTLTRFSVFVARLFNLGHPDLLEGANLIYGVRPGYLAGSPFDDLLTPR